MINEYKILEFKYRFLIIKNMNHLHKLNVLYNTKYEFRGFDNVCIYDYDQRKPLIFFNGNISKTLLVKKERDLSFLEPYITKDINILYNADKIKANIKKLKKIYAIEGVWIAYTYLTNSEKLRICINTNIFGNFKSIGSRDFNIVKLLSEQNDYEYRI